MVTQYAVKSSDMMSVQDKLAHSKRERSRLVEECLKSRSSRTLKTEPSNWPVRIWTSPVLTVRSAVLYQVSIQQCNIHQATMLRKMPYNWKLKWGNKTSSSEEGNLIPRERDDVFKTLKKVRKLKKHSAEKEHKRPFSDPPDVSTVTEIQKLIKDRKIKEANCWIVKHKDKYTSLNNAETTPNQQMMLDVDNLLEELKSMMWSLNTPLHNLEDFLLLVHNVAQLEDERDLTQWEQKLETGNLETGRPRAWKQQFTEIVQQFVQKQIPLFTENNVENSVMEHVRNLQQTVLNDLLSFLNQNEIFKIFAKEYHACIFRHLEQILQANLDIEDLFSVFVWVTHTYKSEEFMGHPSIRNITLKASVLDPILEANWIYSASEKLISTVQVAYEVKCAD
ncbi:exocyst complex component 3-like protein [Cetorhinus maximus]